MKAIRYSALFLAAAILLTGCGSNVQIVSSSMQTVESGQTEHPEQPGNTADSAEPAEGSGASIAEMLGVEDYNSPWKREEYPELDLTDIPAKGEGTVRTTLMPYALDDVCVFLLAEDAYSDGGKIYCTSLKLGLTVSGVEQDITEAPESLAASDGTFEFDPENWREQVGYISMPEVYYGINSLAGEGASGCEYYTIKKNDETQMYRLEDCGQTEERCRLTPNTLPTLPPKESTGTYSIGNSPAVVSCEGTLPQQEALDILAVKYLDSLTVEDPDRSVTVLEYRDLTAEVLGGTLDMPSDESGQVEVPWNTLETWELDRNTWIVDIHAQFRGDGLISGEISMDPDAWHELSEDTSGRCYLMYNDGVNWYLWLRNAYRAIPDIL